MIRQFGRTRRSAVAIMFALCLLPLVLLIGLAIDTAFYSQARTQVGLAAEAAATHAVRVAAGAYTLDIAKKESQATAANDGVSQGIAAGTQWFSAQLGPLLRASTQNVSVGVTPTTSADGGNNGAGFTGTVTYSISYPPIFSALFGSKSNWQATATAGAQSAFQYVEVLLLIDTSNSMLIGANESDIATMAEDSVCPQVGTTTSQEWITSSVGLNALSGNYDSNTLDSDAIDFTKVPFYNNLTNLPTNTGGSCQNAQQSSNGISHQPSAEPAIAGVGSTLDACSLACHTVTTKASDGYYQDLYGMARREGVTLRLDVVISATEKVIEDLYNAEQSANQFTVGVYQFNTDVSAIVAGQSGDANEEATANLEGTSTSALSTIENNYDYNYNPAETNIPAITPASLLNTANTNFPGSAADFLAGNATGGTALKAVVNTTANPAGSSSTNPEKNIFIVTDGFEDYGTSLYTRYMGEMTSYKNEEAHLSTATCQKFKNLGFSVYVLYVVYYPIPHITFYYPPYASFYSQTDATDFSQLAYGASAAENTLAGAPSGLSLAEVEGSNPDTGSGLGSGEVGPDTEALEACASPGDFYEASSSTDITNAMEAMLRSAISSSITVTQ
jgi:Flp pilus assembly protein TadG